SLERFGNADAIGSTHDPLPSRRHFEWLDLVDQTLGPFHERVAVEAFPITQPQLGGGVAFIKISGSPRPALPIAKPQEMPGQRECLAHDLDPLGEARRSSA